MNIGDRVIILRCDTYKNRFEGQTGKVWRLSDLCRSQVGILVDGQVNTGSKYGVFWFPKKSVELDSGSVEDYVYESEENFMLKGYHVVFVEFEENLRKIPYACYDEDIKEGDMVAVATLHHGFCVARVVEVVQNPDPDISVNGRQIISKIDFGAYNERIEREEKMKKLKKEMDAKVREIQATTLYEMMAEKDPVLAEMLEQFKALSGQ